MGKETLSSPQPVSDNPDASGSKKVDFGEFIHPDQEQKTNAKHAEMMDRLAEAGIDAKPSSSAVPHTFTDVLARVTQEAGLQGVEWILPPAGEEFQKDYDKLQGELPKLQDIMSGIAGIGDAGCDKVNQFLQDAGFSMRLQPQGRPDSAYAVSILDVKFKWATPGSTTDISLVDPDPRKPDILLSDDREKSIKVVGAKFDSGFEVLKTPKGTQVIKMNTENGENIYIIPAYDINVTQDATTLRRQIDGLQKVLTPSDEKFASVSFPLVNYEKSGDIAELLGAKTPDGNYQIAQAIYQHIFKMDEIGGRAAGAAAAEVRSRGLNIQNELTIAGPFLVWVEKDGIPVFQAHIQYDAMKRPPKTTE